MCGILMKKKLQAFDKELESQLWAEARDKIKQLMEHKNESRVHCSDWDQFNLHMDMKDFVLTGKIMDY